MEGLVIIDPEMSSSEELEVIFPLKEGVGIHRMYKDTHEIINAIGPYESITLGNIKSIAITCLWSDKKNQVLAMLNKDNEVIIAQSKLKGGKATKFMIDECENTKIEWCGVDSAVLIYPNKVLLIGSSDTKVEIPIESNKGFHVCNEIDGLRILTSDFSYFLERVPNEVEKVLSALSSEASAQIITAYQKYLTNNPNAESLLREIKEESIPNFITAIREILNAATHELDIEHQKYLIKAASFAKNFLVDGEYNAKEIVLILDKLRLLNQLHKPKVVHIKSDSMGE